ncbi:hypothetical protein PFISCL1PPCAC_11383, partial [Pristionchus fissidentatus]
TVELSLWMRNPWSTKEPDLLLNYVKIINDESKGNVHELFRCAQTLGFVGFRKSLYLMKGTKKGKMDVTMECLILGNYDFETPLIGIFDFTKNDERFRECPKKKDTALGETICFRKEAPPPTNP